MERRIWFITGCATGFGRALAETALGAGDGVAVTDRDVASVKSLSARYPDNALPLQLDVTRPDEVRRAIGAAFVRFGRIDVLVNNAGYGMQAAVEEADEAQVRRMFDVNFFGLVDVIRTAVPRLRQQGSGHIINFASVGGRVSAPLLALYSASKFAVEGLSEGLAQELAHLGIKVTAVEPGAFATRFSASAVTAEGTLDAYRPIRDRMEALIGDLPLGDPQDLADAIVELVRQPDPPLRFIAGADAYAMIEGNLQAQREEMAAWRDLGRKANRAASHAG